MTCLVGRTLHYPRGWIFDSNVKIMCRVVALLKETSSNSKKIRDLSGIFKAQYRMVLAELLLENESAIIGIAGC